MGRNKLESISLRVSAEFKQQVITQARAQNRSMTTYLEWLVMQDAATTRAEQRASGASGNAGRNNAEEAIGCYGGFLGKGRNS